MRVGDYKSASYRRLQSRLQSRKRSAIARLCHRLDRLVIRAEKLRSGKVRKSLLARADAVREKLRELDH